MKKTFSPLDDFVASHETKECIKWLSETLREACATLSDGYDYPEYTVGALSSSLNDAAYVARLLDKQLNPEDSTATIVA